MDSYKKYFLTKNIYDEYFIWEDVNGLGPVKQVNPGLGDIFWKGDTAERITFQLNKEQVKPILERYKCDNDCIVDLKIEITYADVLEIEKNCKKILKKI